MAPTYRRSPASQRGLLNKARASAVPGLPWEAEIVTYNVPRRGYLDHAHHPNFFSAASAAFVNPGREPWAAQLRISSLALKARPNMVLGRPLQGLRDMTDSHPGLPPWVNVERPGGAFNVRAIGPEDLTPLAPIVSTPPPLMKATPCRAHSKARARPRLASTSFIIIHNSPFILVLSSLLHFSLDNDIHPCV